MRKRSGTISRAVGGTPPAVALFGWIKTSVIGVACLVSCSANTASTDAALDDDSTSARDTDATGANGGSPDSSPTANPDGPASSEAAGADDATDSSSDPTFVTEDGAPLVVDGCSVEPCAGSQAPPDCGDGVLTEDEACDDGNLESGDGCAANCLATEPGFSCAAPGRPCQLIARCGDGLVASSEQCDDGNSSASDGCSPSCRIEKGKKCSGEPSVCTDATCGDGITEGAEGCDDGNTTPFDGCSPSCEREPNCTDASCTSDCGDGIVINEACDDGNKIDGDGCSASCEIEAGFTCEPTTAECERVANECVLRVPVIYRDFSDTHPDFGNQPCNELVLGALAPNLAADRLPRMSGGDASTRACLSTDENLADWYSDTARSLTVVRELVLFDNQLGGYVNRFGTNGERFEAVDPASEKNGGASLDECSETCVSHARNGEEPMFDTPLRCEDECRPLEQTASSLVSGELSELQGDLNRASDAVPRDDTLIATIEAEIAAVQAQLVEFQAAVTECESGCGAELDARVAVCAATCSPCGSDTARYCIGGEAESFDGTPLFFPLDDVQADTTNRAPALIPAQYGYSNWPWEHDIFPDAEDHNFFFTSEVRHWFRYDETTSATLAFLGDDDVWVFVNGQLLVDLGGIHAPALGSVTIDAAQGRVISDVSDGLANGYQSISDLAAAELGLQPGNVYEVAIFHAERQLDGSSFKLTLSGFESEPSECAAICGDAILSFGEECDDGDNDGGYGECEAGCVLGPFCGDGIVQQEFGEDCDDGPAASQSCPGCRKLRVRVR